MKDIRSILDLVSAIIPSKNSILSIYSSVIICDTVILNANFGILNLNF